MLEDLVRFQTVSGETAPVDALCAWLTDELRSCSLHVRTYRVNGLPALVATPSRSKRVTLWCAAHLDVVPAPAHLFEPVLRAGKLYGRGVFDMKFAVVCYLALIRELGRELCEYDVGFLFTSDEEMGGHTTGVRHLLLGEGYTGTVAFLPDGVGSWVFEEAAKGMLRIEAEAIGVRAHGARPWHGRSAIHHLCAFVHDTVGAFDVFARGHGDEEHWHTTMHVGRMEGGETHNVVAPSAHAVFDIRYPSLRDRVRITRTLDKLTHRHEHVRVRVVHDAPPYGMSRRDPYARVFARIARERHGIVCRWGRAHGSSDARFFHEAGIPTLLIQPTGGGGHTDREWIDAGDLERYYDVFAQFVREVARKKRRGT